MSNQQNNQTQTPNITEIEWKDAEHGVFIGHNYCPDEDAVWYELNDMEPENRPKRAIAAKRVDYKIRPVLYSFCDELYDEVGADCYEQIVPYGAKMQAIKEAADAFDNALKAADIHWFEPIDYRDKKTYVILPEMELDT